jgi:hypothetical protein
VASELDAHGAATIERLLTPAQCEALASLYTRDEAFRSRVVMARHGFGQGEYRYLRYPLPPLIAELRVGFYEQLVPIANRWHEAMGQAVRFRTTRLSLRCTPPARPNPRRCCCTTRPATSTACTRISR